MKIAVLQIVLFLEITISTAGKNLKYPVIPPPSFAEEEPRCGQIKSLAEVTWFIGGNIRKQGSDLQSSGRPVPPTPCLWRCYFSGGLRLALHHGRGTSGRNSEERAELSQLLPRGSDGSALGQSGSEGVILRARHLQR